jgi:hypothetical protein
MKTLINLFAVNPKTGIENFASQALSRSAMQKLVGGDGDPIPPDQNPDLVWWQDDDKKTM